MPLVLDISNLQQSVASQGNFKNNMNFSFFNKKQGPTIFSLRSGVGMMASDLPDLLTKLRPSGPTGPNWNYSGNSDSITMRVTDTTLVERLRMYEPIKGVSRKLLCLVPGPTGDDGFARYNVRWTDSRELDVSGATGPVTSSTSKTTTFGLIYTYDADITTGAKYKIRFNEDNPAAATGFYIGTLDDDDPHNDVTTFLSTWNDYGAVGNRGLVWIVQQDDYSNGLVFRIQKQYNVPVGSLYRHFQITNVLTLGDGVILDKKHRLIFNYTGPEGQIGPTGPTGSGGGGEGRGDTGLTGASAPFFYENLSLIELKREHDCCVDNNYIYYQGFVAGMDTTINQIRIRVQDGAAVLSNDGANHPVTMAIYNSEVNFVGSPQQEQYTPTSRNGDARQVTANGLDNQFLTIDYTSYSMPNPPVLQRGKFYFIALKQDDNGGAPQPHALTFWGDRDAFQGNTSLESGSAGYKTQKTYDPTSLPTSTPTIVPDKYAGFWFQLYGSPAGSILGPTGWQGPQGLPGTGAQGPTGANSIIPGPTGPPGTGPTGAQGIAGATGSQGEKGIRGEDGLTGGIVYANTVYQTWDLANTNIETSVEGQQTEKFIYYHGFIAPTSGVFTKLQVKIQDIGGDSGYKAELLGAIYNTTGSFVGNAFNTGFNTPYLALTSRLVSVCQFPYTTNPNINSGSIIEMNLKTSETDYDGKPEDGNGVYLEKGNVYWVGIRWKNTVNTSAFSLLSSKAQQWGDNQHSSFTKATGFAYNSNDLPLNASIVPNMSGPVADANGAGFWFRLTGEDVPAGPQGYTGAEGPQGAGGPGITGPQGLTGPIGPQGTAGDVNIWYESWDPVVRGLGETGVNSNNHVYWHAFIAPQTGIYTNIKVRKVDQTGNPVTLYAGVYSSNDSWAEPIPQQIISAQTSNQIVGSTNFSIVDIPIGNVPLTRGKIYFIGLKWKAETGGHMFACSDMTTKYWAYRSQYTYTPSELPLTASFSTGSGTSNVNENIQASFWFVIYGPQTAAGAAAGPQGLVGPTGLTGVQGLQGLSITGPQGPAGLAGSASSMLLLRLPTTVTTVTDSYIDVPFSITPIYQAGTLWDLTAGAHIGVSQGIRAFITYSGTIWVPDGQQNKNSFLRLNYKPNGGSWSFVNGTTVAFGSTASGNSGPAGIANTYTAYGSHIMTLNPGDKIKISVFSYSSNIDLLGYSGVDGTNYGDTYIQIIDMLGGAEGPTGLQGLEGPQGFPGTGATGPQGLQGIIGNTGSQGFPGTGAQGDQGLAGAAGAQGDQGLAGAAGAAGAQGDQGLAGAAGAQGDQGLAGAAGAAGAQGDQGLAGAAGAAGAQGDQGLAGVAGAQGDQGLAGAQGAIGSGAQGAAGAQGDVGEQITAKTFEITVVNSGGNKYAVDGVVQDTIYLFRGHKYVIILDGTLQDHPFVVQEANTSNYGGVPYNTGFTPVLPLIGLNTVTFIVPVTAPNNLYYRCQLHPGMGGDIIIKNFVPNELTGAQGALGPQGTIGAGGAQGDQGLAGAQGAVGSGAQGLAGAAGAQGDQGLAGAAGAQGDQGLAGAAGAQGDQGLAGAAGAQGDQGLAGAAGAQGDQGLAGPVGAQGDEGLHGAQGAVGTNGAQGAVGSGAQGAVGTAGAQGDQGLAGAAGAQGDQGLAGTAGAQGDQGLAGTAGAQGDQGLAGAAGAQGDQGLAGTAGAQGDQGLVGAQGTDGNFGGATFDYHTHLPAGVGAPDNPGGVLFNNSNQNSSTKINIDDADDDGNSISTFITTITNVSNPILGFVRISNKLDSSQFLLFHITAIQTVSSGSNTYYELTVTNQGSSAISPFSDSEDVIISFVTNGNQGASGAQGAIGTAGSQGATGIEGAQGAVGPQGITGTPGSASAAIRVRLTSNQTNLGGAYIGIKFDGTPTFSQGGIWTITEGTGNIGTYIKTSQAINAFIAYGFAIDDDGNNNDNVFVKLQTTNNISGSSWSDVIGSKITNSSPSATPHYYGSSGTCMINMPANTYIRAVVFSTSTDIDLESGTNGDTYLSIHDMFGGTAGAQGAIGSAGAQGDEGLAGAQGAVGFNGAQGAGGPSGAQGTTGVGGAQGAVGPGGAQGSPGGPGTQGPAGAVGAQGDQGLAGAQGAAGAAGAQGDIGAAGAQGDNGAQGAAGAQGLAGAQGAAGAQGVPGLGGPQGGNGAQGVVGPGWKAQGVFKFMMDLKGEKTQWGPNGEPPSLVNSNVSGLTNLTGFEFFKIAPAFYLDVKFPAFPLQNGSQGIITPTIPSRICQNTMYGYLMPANGEILGFSVDFVRLGRGAQFRVFGWNPASNTVTFTTEVKSVNADYEEYGSGTTNLEEKLPIKAGQYLFAIQPIAGMDHPALGPAHITAYVRFTD